MVDWQTGGETENKLFIFEQLENEGVESGLVQLQIRLLISSCPAQLDSDVLSLLII